jgi:hypothetical protein
MQVPVSVVAAAAGNGYAVNDTITLPGGSVLIVLVVTGSGGITTVAVLSPTPVSTTPANPVTPVSTSGQGVNATFTVTWQTTGTPTPVCAQAPLLGAVALTTANANRDGTGTLSAAVSAGQSGSLVDFIVFKAQGTTTLGCLRIFFNDGTTTWLIDEILTAAITPSGTVVSDQHVWYPYGGVSLPLPQGTSLKFSTANTENWQVLVGGSNY